MIPRIGPSSLYRLLLLICILVGLTSCKNRPSDESKRALKTSSIEPAEPRRNQEISTETVTKKHDIEMSKSITQTEANELVDVSTAIPNAVIDLRYATTNNFTGKIVYETPRCLLRANVLTALQKVEAAARAKGFSLWIWDCYRPFSAQEKLWSEVPDEKYVARPVRKNGKLSEGSKHNRGAAVDLSLYDLKSSAAPIAMPTAYDDFSEKAHRNFAGATAKEKQNSRMLESLMTEFGFEPMPTEWWHFDGPGWKDYPLEDIPLSSFVAP